MLKVALVAVVPIVLVAIIFFRLVIVAIQITVMFAVHGVVVAFRGTLMVYKVPLRVLLWVFQQDTALLLSTLDKS